MNDKISILIPCYNLKKENYPIQIGEYKKEQINIEDVFYVKK